MKFILLFLSTILFISGCSDKKVEDTSTDPNISTKTVEWYLANPDEHKAQLKNCANNPAQLSKTANCINAEAAADKKAMGYGKFKPK